MVLSTAHFMDFCGATLDTQERTLALLDALPCAALLRTGALSAEEARIAAALRRAPSEAPAPIDIALLSMPAFASLPIRSWRVRLAVHGLRAGVWGMHRANLLA
ncbi:MAG: hypothetical protein IPF99_30290, partial [Deltaproteobacteria bacterium]|nr:hypothetical protein [Deltaproteobacteria bacterium]